MYGNDSVRLTRDVEANLVPSGDKITLKKGELVFEDTKKQLNNVKEINIDNGKKKISIFKNQDSNWYMSSKSNYKTKNETVRKNLIQISELRFFEQKTEQESLYSRLDLDYPKNDNGDSKLITILDDDKKKIIEFILGKKKKNGVYIKKLNERQTWLTSGTLEMSSIEHDWLETKILDINYENVKKVTINRLNKKESFSLTKDDKNEKITNKDFTTNDAEQLKISLSKREEALARAKNSNIKISRQEFEEEISTFIGQIEM